MADEPESLERTREELLVLRCQVGDDGAFERLFDRYSGRLLYYLRRLVGRPGAADDVLQRAWLKVYRRIGTLKEPRAFRSWLYRIARNEAISLLRSERRRVELDEADEGEHLSIDPDETDDDPAWHVEPARLHGALERLSAPHREVLTLFYLEDLPYAEIAEVVGCPVGTVRSRLHYARKHLRRELEKTDEGTDGETTPLATPDPEATAAATPGPKGETTDAA